MMFSTKESKLDTSFQPSLLSNTELSHKTQQKTCMIGNRKSFDIPLPILTENTENFSLKKCGAKLVMMTNQPVARPEPTSNAYSQAKHFFSSIT